MKSSLTELSASLYRGDKLKIDKEEFEILTVKRKFQSGQAIQMDVTVKSNVDESPIHVTITPKNVHEFI